MGDGFEYFSRAGRSVMRLESAGIDLAATTDIVITHMHMDHVGGLNVAGVKAKLRPDVRIHVSAAEVEFSKNPDFSKTVMPESVPPRPSQGCASSPRHCPDHRYFYNTPSEQNEGKGLTRACWAGQENKLLETSKNT
ncbi:phosphoribosyl 1,2-cyclic phosphodiesterase [Paraburkholderia youngii]